MKEFSVLLLLTDLLIGKKFKHCIKSQPVMQPYNIWKKKSNGVTDKQYESGDLRFRKSVTRNNRIGTHLIFETEKIINVCVQYGDYNEGDYLCLILENNDNKVYIGLNDKIKLIDTDTYMICN